MTPSNALFDQPWWLDAVAPGAWEQVEVAGGDGSSVARLPFVRRTRFGLTVVSQPSLTQALGPALAATEGKYARRLELEKERMEALISALPPFAFFRQNFAPAITNWLPFYWAGFTATARYTYRLEDLADLDAVWAEFTDSTRRQVRRAERVVEVRDDFALDRFLELNEMTFRRQGLPVPHGLGLIRRIDEAAGGRDARRLLAAIDAQGRTHAAIYLVFDERAAYYLIGARDDELRSSGATSLLLWEAIRFAAGRSRVFDFEGSMIESIERFFRGFGAKQVPYFRVEKARGLARPVLAARELAGREPPR